MSKFLFSKVPGTKVVHSTFNNSNQSLVTIPFGKLIPIICEEVLPGDTLRSSSSVVARMQPMLSPVFANVRMFYYDFFVPNRIDWSKWEDFIATSDDVVLKPSFTLLSNRYTLNRLIRERFGAVSNLFTNFGLDHGAFNIVNTNSNYKLSPLSTFLHFGGLQIANDPTLHISMGNTTDNQLKLYAKNCLNLLQDLEDLFGDGSLLDYLGFPSVYSYDFLGRFIAQFTTAKLDSEFAKNTYELTKSVIPSNKRFAGGDTSNYYLIIKDELTKFADGRYNRNNGSDHLYIFAYVFFLLFPFASVQTPDDFEQFDALPLLAYFRIYLDYFRSESFEYPQFDDNVSLFNGTGEISSEYFDTLIQIRTKCWPRDYFTSALDSPQHGKEVFVSSDNSESIPVADDKVTLNNHGLFSINQLRLANSTQRFLEALQRGGHRYVETIKAFFGERVPDYRVNRCEYLKGSFIPLKFDEIIQTSQSTENQPLGDYAGHGRVDGSSRSTKYHSVEHGFFIRLIAVIPTASYYQGVPRKFTRSSRYDYYFNSFENLGEQSVDNKELYLTGIKSIDSATFGYMPRYSDYKYRLNEVHGSFRHSMAYWTMSRYFSDVPALGKQFLHVDNVTTDKPFPTQPMSELYWDKGATQMERKTRYNEGNDVSNKIYALFVNSYIVNRAMHKQNIPSL